MIPGSVPLTTGSGSGWPKNMRIRIPNTWFMTTSCFQLSEAPSAQRGKVGAETIAKKNKAAEEEIEQMLAQLKS
jgi:hypothetical protein